MQPHNFLAIRCLLLHSLLLYGVSARIRTPSVLSPNDIPPKATIPPSLVGMDSLTKADVPGKPLDPNDFLRAEEIKIVRAPPIDGEDPIMAAGKFQGDIILPDNFILKELNEHIAADQSLKPQKNAIIDESSKWANGVIPYVIADSYDQNERAIIAKAMGAFHQQTCVRFVPRSSDPDYIFIRKGSGCSSPVGRVGGEQQVSLGTGCVYYGIVIHELMHTTGFWHEQSRADRDNHITIIWNNILAGTEYNFQKYDWNIIQSLGAPYDTGSIMHYGPNAFAKDRAKPTIVANNGDNIGQRNSFSTIDAQKLNTLYQCPGTGSTGTEPPPIVTTKAPTNACVDSNAHCEYWSGIGECSKNPSWMNNNCKKSCKQCGICQDDDELCGDWAATSQCEQNPGYMHKHCKKSCGICNAPGMTSECKDDNPLCKSWADLGECRRNASYMLVSCRLSCGTCGKKK